MIPAAFKDPEGFWTGFAARALPPLRHHLEGPRHAATPTWALLRRKEIVMMLGAAAAMTWSVFMIVPYVRSFLQNNHHVPEGDIKFLYLVGGIASFAVVRLTGPTVDRVGSTPVAALGTAPGHRRAAGRVPAGGAAVAGVPGVLAVHVHGVAARRAAVGC